MEHGALNLPERAAANLRFTYLRLGEAGGGRTERCDGYLRCRSERRHPLVNFALDLDLDPYRARALREDVGDGPFHVYLAPGDRPEGAGELLRRAGFHHGRRLRQLARAPGERRAEPAGERVPPEDRPAVTQFMAGQFFARRDAGYRRVFAEGIAQCRDAELWAIYDRGRLRAAGMAMREAGTVGIYNLCVESAHRGRGLGRALLERIAADEDGPAVLQCAPERATWYEGQGFASAGEVDLFLADSAPNRGTLL